MERLIAVISMLHEGADRHSASRLFRRKPVLDWTLRRLHAARSIDTAVIFCWDDQLQVVNEIADQRSVGVISKGERQIIPRLSAIAAARRWADGWRSGLLGSCDFELGFHSPWVSELIQLHDADAAVLIDPSSALLDPVLLESLVEYAEVQCEAELCFMQAAPGLTGTLVRRELVERLAIANVHPGRLLTYYPDQHGVDPVGKPGCAPVPKAVARSTYRFKLDSDRQIARAEHAMAHLNGHLISTEAEELAINMRGVEIVDRLPREVVLELNTRRATAPIYSPAHYLQIDRPDLPVAEAAALFKELSVMDDIRLTIAGVGDPLLSPAFFEIVAQARAAGITSIGVETDLLEVSREFLCKLAACGLDVITVHFPAATAAAYQQVMGVDGFSKVLENLAILEEQIILGGKGTPLIAPLFMKMTSTISGMELWYDYWIRRFGHAVITSPSDYAGQIPDLALADMASPARAPCRRLASRITILSSGQIVSCEQDVLGKQSVGSVGQRPIQEIWQDNFGAMRRCHQNAQWSEKPLCGSCREWHRA